MPRVNIIVILRPDPGQHNYSNESFTATSDGKWTSTPGPLNGSLPDSGTWVENAREGFTLSSSGRTVAVLQNLKFMSQMPGDGRANLQYLPGTGTWSLANTTDS